VKAAVGAAPALGRAALGLAALTGLTVTAATAGVARAEDAPPAEPSHAPTTRKSGWVDLFFTTDLGDGLRFENPYRLATVLGANAESLSRTAAYADVGVAMAFGDPATLAHGVALRTTVALEGVEQAIFTPTYLALHRSGPWGFYGRAGPSIVLTPDTTWGLEGSAGALWFPRAGIGLTAELVGDLYWGAGTNEVEVATYPVLSAQGGLWLSWEAMP